MKRFHAEVRIDRKILTSGMLAHGSHVMIERAERDTAGSYWDIVGSVIFSAFSLEAMLNHIGSHAVEAWEEMDRLPWRKKVSILYRHARLVPGYGRFPLQTVTELFAVRDALAHGRVQEIEFGPKEMILSEGEQVFDLGLAKARWEELCTIEKAKAFRLAVIEVGNTLANALKIKVSPFGSTETSGFSVRYIRDADEAKG